MGMKLRGAAKITHAINEYGGNNGMIAGLKKFANDNRDLGYRKAVSEMQSASIIDRLLVNLPKRRNK